jgi:hypothetical protein
MFNRETSKVESRIKAVEEVLSDGDINEMMSLKNL